MLKVKRSRIKCPPSFNEFTLVSVNFNKHEAMKLHNLDEIEVDMLIMCLTST